MTFMYLFQIFKYVCICKIFEFDLASFKKEHLSFMTKGQLISKFLFGTYHRFDQNSKENIVMISALKVFIASLGLPRSFFGLPVGFFY